MDREKSPWELPVPLLAALRRVWLCLNHFGQKGIANHAAAGAYGFLLSLMPALLLAAFLNTRLFGLPGDEAAKLITRLGFLGGAFDIEGITRRFLAAAGQGVAGLFSFVSLLFAAIVFAFSLQRGLNSIFFDQQKKSGPVKNNLIPLGLEIAIIVYVFAMTLYARFSPARAATPLSGPLLGFFALAGLGLLIFGTYRAVPVSAPKKSSALAGTVVCLCLFGAVSGGFNLFMNLERYHLLYGAMGDSIFLLAKVYFFFMFFFIGAQYAFVAEYFDALLFSKLRTLHGNTRPFIVDRILFSSCRGRLERYFRRFDPDSVVFRKGEYSREIYYILSGEAGVYLDDEGKTGRVALITAGNFFGEMGHVLASRRAATVRAETGLAVLALPPALFAMILKTDQTTDKKVIENLSTRLKDTNELVDKV